MCLPVWGVDRKLNPSLVSWFPFEDSAIGDTGVWAAAVTVKG